MMKKTVLLLFLLLLCISSAAYSLEIGTRFHIGNNAFDRARTADQTDFTGLAFPWGIDAYVNHAVDERIGIHTGFFMDPILQNTVYTLFTYRHSFLHLSVGPFFGLFNSTSTLLKSGISTTIRLEFPGIIFIQFRTDSSIGGRLVQAGDYLQERNELFFGFNVPHAICSLGLTTKKYTQLTDTSEVVDNLHIYSFKTDIYQKNVPYKILVNFSIHSLKKSFFPVDPAAASSIHSLNSLVAGFKVDITLTDFLIMSLSLDSSIYTFGTNALLGVNNPGPGGYLFEAGAGVLINIDTIIQKGRL